MLSILRRAAAGLTALAMTLAGGNAFAAWNELNLPVGVTPISRAVYDLHMLMLWICVIIGIIVFGAILSPSCCIAKLPATRRRSFTTAPSPRSCGRSSPS
ncbi:MAG: hypothetical protein V3R72_07400 [Gammaproteobacteria bacterium]